jgi:hypothetical protein
MGKFEIENPHPPADPSEAGGQEPAPISYRIRRHWIAESRAIRSLRVSERKLRAKWQRSKLPRPPG